MVIVQSGSEGAAVSRVQTLVNSLGFKPRLVVDGIAGPNTVAGIKWAQRLLRVTQDGQWGPATDAAAQRRLSGAPEPPAVHPPKSGDVNVDSLHWLMRFPGPKEQYSANDGPWLRAEEHEVGADWMWKGHQPYCALVGAEVAFHEVGIELGVLFPTVNWAYCPSIEAAIRKGLVSRDRKWRWLRIQTTKVRFGDTQLYRWPGANVVGHYGRATASPVQLPSGLWVHAFEANTPKAGGDQSGLGAGDGLWPKMRPLSQVQTAGRLVPA